MCVCVYVRGGVKDLWHKDRGVIGHLVEVFRGKDTIVNMDTKSSIYSQHVVKLVAYIVILIHDSN